MGQLDPQRFEQLNGLGARFREGIDAAFRANGIRGQATGAGSLANLHLTDAPLHDARESLAAATRAGSVVQAVHLGMLRRGIASAGRLMYCISTPMGAAEVDLAVDALGDCLRELRPDIEREKPELLL